MAKTVAATLVERQRRLSPADARPDGPFAGVWYVEVGRHREHGFDRVFRPFH